MYNRYIPSADGYVRVTEEDAPEPPRGTPLREETPREEPPRAAYHSAGRELLDRLTAPLKRLGGEEKNAGLSGILKAFDLEELDSGDVLLVLIILLLLLEGDDLEPVIALGLMLLFSLNDAERERQNE